MYYIVQQGDTLYQIAIQYNTTVSNLVESNPRISNPNRIYVGQRIAVGNQWDLNPWWGNEWQLGNEEYQRGIEEYKRGRAEYRKGRAEYHRGRQKAAKHYR
ncbi:LysM domain-containing protein [Desulfosporosinus acidiphilus SJ4]|uniref:LysM domain-containing protein n=1 Tax=Desulfosporosinus acidiphilus (strain DSM 22704 / JCM 16185 / SJ4) TaxID=646529 RepID=I4D7A5_DESAJ|nr:LysM domain-containing protein [Desulfosporosinus acidiphilus]AFM41679.1 LysM domain-containing protein [Desulfosporosinus acidiphilus SJ4]